ncbi:diguanylate cyclase [Leptolyngbya sp. 15MV]|nr:diguanylate cyclase [Leptolyngbya sp. 15MV]
MAMNFLKGLKQGAARGGETAAVHPLRPAAGDLRARVLDEFDRTGIAWIWATDSEGRLLYLSDKAVDTLGESAGELIGQPLEQVFEIDEEMANDTGGRSLTFQLKARNTIREQVVRFAWGKPQAGVRQTWWCLSGHPVRDEGGEFVGYRGSAKDVTVEYERQIADSRLAEYDSLTGLANRHNINRQLDSTLSSFKSSGRAVALMMLDLDKFKHVNDTLGHQAGDALLVHRGNRGAGREHARPQRQPSRRCRPHHERAHDRDHQHRCRRAHGAGRRQPVRGRPLSPCRAGQPRHTDRRGHDRAGQGLCRPVRPRRGARGADRGGGENFRRPRVAAAAPPELCQGHELAGGRYRQRHPCPRRRRRARGALHRLHDPGTDPVGAYRHGRGGRAGQFADRAEQCARLWRAAVRRPDPGLRAVTGHGATARHDGHQDLRDHHGRRARGKHCRARRFRRVQPLPPLTAPCR